VRPKLFGSSGIRGIANIEVTTALAQRVGAALATMHEGGALVVGRDTRVTGEMLESALVSGAASCGAESKVLGIVPTPVTAWLTREVGAEAGVSISASHNPPQYNGLKVFDGSGMAYTEARQLRLEEVMEGGDFSLAPWDAVGTVEEIDAGWMYIDSLAEALRHGRGWRVACDLFCGATATIAPQVFDELGHDAILINAQPDGHFPAGDPEPTDESLKRLGGVVRSFGAEIGFGFDGDGDRMMAVDEGGEAVSPDRVLAAYAGYVVGERGGGVVVTHVGASMCVDDMVEGAGGRVIRTRVGDANITEAMEEQGAVFGGEPVGAWVHPELHLCPDGILSALKLMEALEETGKTLSEFIGEVPEYPLLREKVECGNERRGRVMESVEENYERAFGGVEGVNAVDGLRIETEKGWALMRPSGTEPIIRITAEGRERGDAEELMRLSRELVLRSLEGSG